jgi:prepilin-type N-terminal cleavage/methylation domain-containing protein
MLTKLNKTKQGFTIVEVMIVLAIAGLILAIILFAVPALERNARNTAIKTDANTVAAGVSTFNSDYSSTAGPATGVADATGTVTITNAAKNSETVKIQGSDTLTVVTKVPATITSGNINVWVGETCENTAVPSAVAVFYPIETSGGTNVGCVDS